MPRFLVTLSALARVAVEVEVEAPDEEVAELRALEVPRDEWVAECGDLELEDFEVDEVTPLGES